MSGPSDGPDRPCGPRCGPRCDPPCGPPCTPDQRRLARALLRRQGRGEAAALGLRLSRNAPSHLFRWLCACLLTSAPIPAATALRAARALADAGWTTPARMACAAPADLVAVLDASGYARYDEKTARMLAATAALVLSRYGGDLRRLRRRAAFDPATERRLLTDFPGIGPVGAGLFCREVQTGWPELFPFADPRALAAAARLGLPADPAALAACVPPARFPALLAALGRAARARRMTKP